MDNIVAIAAVFLVPLLSAIGAIYATRSQLRQAEIARATEERKIAGEQELDLAQFKRQTEQWIWEQAKTELDKMRTRLDAQDATLAAQDATIAEQGGLIMQLRQTIHQQSERIGALETERDNWRNRALMAEGARGKRL